MHIAIVHYHLNRGGVTQVIANHLRALAAAAPDRGEPVRITVLFGGRQDGWPQQLVSQLAGLDVQLCGVPGLDYDLGATARPEKLAEDLKVALSNTGIPRQQTVIHVHNHALGKNMSLPGALRILAEDGYALLLQIHDFAEDFRPDNYQRLVTAITPTDSDALPSHLYPQAGHIHYAVLNQRDFEVLLQSGTDRSQVHLLPNPISEFGPLPPWDEARTKLEDRFGVPRNRRLLLCPVRGIRRKNVGEVLLWSAIVHPGDWVGLTLAPINPTERTSYDRWKGLAGQLQLPCVFGLGEAGGLSLTENLAGADLILTTSVAEGFGMAFAETWLAGCPLVGRDLPEITADFARAGIRFDGLCSRLSVPLSWVGEADFRGSFVACYRRVLSMYNRSEPAASQMHAALDALIVDGTVDFAGLSPRLQQRVIRLIREEAGRREDLHHGNPWIGRALALTAATAEDAIRQNASVIRTHYSVEACGRNLHKLYRTVVESPRDGPVGPPPFGHRVLNTFLHVARLSPIRIEA